MNNGTKSVHVCFGTNCTFPPGFASDDCERLYQNTYKPLLSSLYNIPELPFTLSLSGPLIEWMEHHHPEFFMILEEMVARKQIEILGGGYYSPLFPLIPPVDRVGQIEMLTTALRKFFGKRPRGAWLTASAWEPSMVSSLNTCGIEYILLDRIMLETSGFSDVDGFAPVTLEDCGKTITALPLDNSFASLERFSPESFFCGLAASLERDKERLVVIFLDQGAVAPLFSSEDGLPNWFESFLSVCASRPEGQEIHFTTPGRYLKNRTLYRRAYLSSGLSPYAFDEIGTPDDVRILARTPSKQFLVSSEHSLNLYAKMMYVHVLVNQLRGDKSRKKNAREELWRSQESEMYHTAPGLQGRTVRTLAYKNLLIAEKLSRVRGIFSPSMVSFDFDMDGLKEHVSQLENLNIYVHPAGGKVFELDVLPANRNYCDLCLEKTGLFVDHFVSAEDLSLLAIGRLPAGTPVFADTLYQDILADPARNELQLKANSMFGPFQQPLSLRKQYSFRNEGIQVQYILKNESPLNLSGIFLIEVDLALAENRHANPFMAVYAHDTRQESCIRPASFDDVSWLMINDPDSEVTFTLDANEPPSVTVVPLGCTGSEPPVDNKPAGVRLFLFWKVDLGPNYEMEKMVFLKVNAGA